MKWLRRLGLLLIVLVVLGIAAWLTAPSIARALVKSDPLEHADLIVVLGSHRLQRTIEAGTLFKEGWSRRILLLRSPGEVSTYLMRDMHFTVPVWIDVQKSVLMQLDVPASAIEETDVELGNTRAEAVYTMAFARRTGLKRVIVCTSPYHTRRAGNYFREEARGQVKVIMRANRYETIDPDHWWRRPVDRFDIPFEYVKLLIQKLPIKSRTD